MEPASLDVSKDGTAISISWSDGHKSKFRSSSLRRACPCAMCKGEPGVFGRYYAAPQMQIDSSVSPEAIEPVGRYGIKIKWSDKHEMGIYTFEYLRKLCECELCKTK